MSIPVNPMLDYRLKITVTRNAEAAPQPEYDTADILLWQKDEVHPVGTPQIVEYFTGVCSVADLTLYPVSGGADLLYRKNELDMVFRNESLMMQAFELIMNDINELKQNIRKVDAVVTDGDFNTSP